MRGRCLAAAALAFAAAFAGAGEVTSLPVPPEYAAAPGGFREFDLRDWRFAKDDGALERSPRDVGALEWREVSIPHDWAIEGPFDPAGDGDTGKLPWKGAAWYSTRLPPHFVGYIVFEGVMARSRVFLGGEERGGSDYGYLGFSFPVEKADAARELLVRVDTFAHESRWYPGAGVYRPVRAIWAEGETVAPDSLKIVAESLAPEKATVAVSFDTNSRTGLSFRVEIESPRLWDVDDPHLYEIEVLGRRFRFGLRSAAFTADGGFFLNGRRVELRGACLHADLGILGMAFSKSAARRQLEILKDAGFNAVRTAHNCPAPGLLDLCDEMGLLVWDECFDKWDAKAGRASGQNLEEYVAHYLGLFARRDRNHPCVVAWSIGNEIDRASEKRPDGTTRARCRLFREAVRAEDATRPVAIASCEWFAGLAEGGDYDDLDVVGMNYMGRYAYYHERRPLVPVVESESASCVATQGFYLDGWPARKDDWGVAARAVDASGRCAPGWGDPPDMDFARMARDTYCAGQFVWTGFDYLGENWPVSVREKTFKGPDGAALRPEQEARSSYFGVCDLLGLPKEQYWNYRAEWRKDVPTVVVSPTHWTFPGREGKRRPVQVYSSFDTVELFVNGRSCGRRTKDTSARQYARGDTREEWMKYWGDECRDPEGYYGVLPRYRLLWPDVVYEPGEIVAVAYSKDGGEAARQTLRTALAAASLALRPEKAVLPDDRDELVFVRVSATDKDGVDVPCATNVVSFSVEGPGEIVSVGNADPCCFKSFKDVSSHPLYFGVAGLFLRRTGPGVVTLRASADGLLPAETAFVTAHPARCHRSGDGARISMRRLAFALAFGLGLCLLGAVLKSFKVG